MATDTPRRTELEELRALSDAATPGPWETIVHVPMRCGIDHVHPGPPSCRYDVADPPGWLEDVRAGDKHVVCHGHDYDDYGGTDVVDAAFIVAAVNYVRAALRDSQP